MSQVDNICKMSLTNTSQEILYYLYYLYNTVSSLCLMFVSLSQGQTGQSEPISETNDGVIATMFHSITSKMKVWSNSPPWKMQKNIIS